MAQMKNFSFGLYASLVIGIGLAQTSAAADAPVGDAPPPAGPPSSWSGPYIGLAGGGAWGSSNQIDAGPLGSGPTTHGYGISGGLFGETAGYNFQFGPWVFGPDGDFSWINARGHANEIPPFTTSTVVGTEEDWLGTVRGRFGWTPSDPVLIYATAGIAVADIKASIDAVNSPGFTQARTRWGGTVGAGVEAMLARSWSVKAEYLYVQFVSAGYFSPPPGPGFNTRSNVPVDNDIFRVGINYHF
jgi:outer membrane immunogenic protein